VNFQPYAVYVNQGTTVATVTFYVHSSVSIGEYTFTLEGRAANGQIYTCNFNLNVTPANSDLDLYVLSNGLTIPRGGDATVDLRVISIGSFSSTGCPSSDDTPYRVSIVFSPGNVYLGPGDSTTYTVRVLIDPNAPSDIYYIPLTMTSLDGSIVRSCTFRVHVLPIS